MSAPCEADVLRLKRIIRYLKGAPRVVTKYVWQESPGEVVAYTDSDWAGCVRTRRSTSGGVIMHGSHAIHHWSSTQTTTALSSGEAELNAIIKGGGEVMAIGDLAQDWGKLITKVIKTDSSAASGIAHRQGCGKLRHLDTQLLWSSRSSCEGTSSMRRWTAKRIRQTS